MECAAENSCADSERVEQQQCSGMRRKDRAFDLRGQPCIHTISVLIRMSARIGYAKIGEF